MNGQLSINGSIKNNSFNKIKKNQNIKHLEISYATVSDDWYFIGDLGNLNSLSIKDSFVDFQSFYSAVGKLKNLEKITYNYYCFFNKKKNDKLKNISSSIKVFQIDFPEINEPDFDFNNYLKETYKKKYHSIFEIKECEKIFKNLEEVIFKNYQTFKVLSKAFDTIEKKLFEKIIYWGMETSNLKKFKNLNKINIDMEKKLNLLSLGIYDIIKNKNFINLGIEVNGLKNIDNNEIFSNINILDITEHEYDKKLLSTKILDLTSLSNILNFNDTVDLSLSINPSKLYEVQYGYKKKWKTSKDKNIINIFNNNIKTVVFSDAFSFLDIEAYSQDYAQRKSEIFINLFQNLKSLKNVIFDFSKIEEDNFDSSNNYFLTLFIYEIIKKYNHINIYLVNYDVSELINDNIQNHKFEKHLVYLVSFLLKIKPLLQGKINLFNQPEENLIKFYYQYIHSKIDNVQVVDDIVYNHSNRFHSTEVFYSDFHSARSLFFDIDKCKDQEECIKKIPFGECYWDSLANLYSWAPDELKITTNNLILLIKKTHLAKFFAKSSVVLKNISYQYTSPLSSIGHMIEYNKDFKIKNIKKISDISKKSLEISAKKSVSAIIKSNEFNFSNNAENLFLDRLKTPEYFNGEIEIKKDNLKELKQLNLQGDSPYYGKYIIIENLNNFVPIEKLEALSIKGLINQKNLNFPEMLKLKYLNLDLSYNVYNSLEDKDFDSNIKLKLFKNLPNLEKLELNSLRSSFNNLLLDNIGYNDYHNYGRWHYSGIDFTDIHELNKLKEIFIRSLDSKDIKTIKKLSALEKLDLEIFQTTKEHGPDKDEYLSPPIDDKILSFLKNSKKLKKIKLIIGDVPFMEDLYGEFFSTKYIGSGEFINYISYNVEELIIQINIDVNKQSVIQDIINNICNRFLKLKKIHLKFGITIDKNSFDWENTKYRKKITDQTLDFKKFAKLKNLEEIDMYSWSSGIKFKTVNFKEIIKLKKLKTLKWFFDTIDFKDFREARILFKEEKYDDPTYYDEDYKYNCEDDENYKKNWSRFRYIGTDPYDEEWITLEDRFIELEKEHSKKNYKKTAIVKKKVDS